MARPPALTTESGYVNPSAADPAHWMPGSVPDLWWWELTEQVPDLRWPMSLIPYSRMPREDARCWSVLSAITLPIRRTKFRIDPNGAEDSVVAHMSADLGLPIVGDGGGDKPVPRQRDRFSWQTHLREALSHLRYGHSVFEQVYRYDDTGGPFAGKFHLRKLAARPQFTIRAFQVAEDGGLMWIEQDAPAGRVHTLAAQARRVDISRLVIYRNEPEPGVWIGTSLLRPSYKHWLLKDELMRIQAAAARRNGIGVPVATANEQDSRDPKKMKDYETIAARFRGGISAGAAMPFGSKLEILGVQGNLPDMQQAIEYHDKQIALAGLAHFLNLDKGGSYALASVQADVFVQSVQALADDVIEVFNQHVIEDLVDVNYGIDYGAPLLVCDEIGSRQDATAAALAMLVQAGLLDADAALKAFIRQQLGAPALDPNFKPPAPPAPAPTDEPDADPDDEPSTARQQSKPDLGNMSLMKQGVLF